MYGWIFVFNPLVVPKLMHFFKRSHCLNIKIMELVDGVGNIIVENNIDIEMNGFGFESLWHNSNVYVKNFPSL